MKIKINNIENNIKLKIENRKSILVELKDWCIMSMSPKEKDNGHYLEVTEWGNGEGYDINIHDVNGERSIPLTYGQFDVIEKCIKTIEKSYETKSI